MAGGRIKGHEPARASSSRPGSAVDLCAASHMRSVPALRAGGGWTSGESAAVPCQSALRAKGRLVVSGAYTPQQFVCAPREGALGKIGVMELCRAVLESIVPAELCHVARSPIGGRCRASGHAW